MCSIVVNDQKKLSGDPRGSILGPLLFTIFFNDIFVVLMYADDLNLLISY